ncbi:hypothetical protein [Methylotenera sp. N17]|uniref:hypothetical protein n=1 Tax=Methylotenera sp. N17 TaxID=1502761 RepID=UPI0006474AE1|nr:hypothetical protein [Methylotenera sp. N17]
MTAIAIWGNYENNSPSLWIAADSRINHSSTSILIEDAAKVFVLPVICRSPGAQGFFSEVSYENTFGYCFSGSTLIGQNTFLAILPLLSNLISSPGYVVPMSAIAKFIHSYFLRTFDDYKEFSPVPMLAELALFGFCHATNKLCIFHFKPVQVDGIFSISYTAHEDIKDKDFIYLGDRSEEMKSRLRTALSAALSPDNASSRSPRNVINSCIHDETFSTIGGDIQLGIANAYGYKAYSLCKPRVPGEPEAYISYLGREISEDISRVGDALISIPAMI